MRYPAVFGLSRTGAGRIQGTQYVAGDLGSGFVAVVPYQGLFDLPVNPSEPEMLLTASVVYSVDEATNQAIVAPSVAADGSEITLYPNAVPLGVSIMYGYNANTGHTPIASVDNRLQVTTQNESILDSAATSAPAAGAQATCTAAGGAIPIIVTSIDATLIIPPAANQPLLTLNLISNGVTIWQHRFGVGAAVANGLVQSVSLSGLNINCTSSATLEFSAAGVAGVAQSVAMTYHPAP